MVRPVSEEELQNWTECLMNPKEKLVKRSQALWGLRHAAEPKAFDALAKFAKDYVHPNPIANDLLQHEAVYCLGQRGDLNAVPCLIDIIQNDKHAPIIRHEAGEALAALASCSSANLDQIENALNRFKNCEIVEVAETCQIGLKRLNWIRECKQSGSEQPSDMALAFFPDTVDPAPSFNTDSNYSNEQLRDLLMNPNEDLFIRYRAMFTLRDRVLQLRLNNSEVDKVVDLLSDGLLSDNSALLRHEVAFVLGQLAISSAVPKLVKCLQNVEENPMVRHEAAEALGSVLGELEGKFLAEKCRIPASNSLEENARHALQEFSKDSMPVVSESCVLALDIADYVSSTDRFQYANVPC